jgi:hypothetical protein
MEFRSEVAALKLCKRRACWACGATESVKLCYGCKFAFYCDTACQRTDRRRHKPACKALAAAVAAAFPDHDAV